MQDLTTDDSSSRPAWRRARTAGPGGDLGSVLDELEGVTNVLERYVPDPRQGAEWVEFDSALVDLHRAILSLRAVERSRPGTSPARDVVTAAPAGPAGAASRPHHVRH